jgi:hypothetical protein
MTCGGRLPRGFGCPARVKTGPHGPETRLPRYPAMASSFSEPGYCTDDR